jgi:TrmH family RNA methyltransferase
MTVVTSRQHALVKECRAIARGADPRLLLDGWHLLADALAAGVPLEGVAFDGGRAAQPAAIERARAAGASIVEVTAAVIEAMSPVRTASGVVAVADRPAIDSRALVAPAPALVLGAFGVQDPGNVGALVRSVDAAGGTGVLFAASTADPWGWKALRAAMGSTFRLPVRRDEAAIEHLRAWQRDGIRVLAAVPRDGTLLYEIDLMWPVAFVLGAEGAGLPADVLDVADQHVRVPMRARVDSLNVGVAGAVLAYEAARQRGAVS